MQQAEMISSPPEFLQKKNPHQWKCGFVSISGVWEIQKNPSRGSRNSVVPRAGSGKFLECFPVRVVMHWHKFPTESVDVPSLEVFKMHLDEALISLV